MLQTHKFNRYRLFEVYRFLLFLTALLLPLGGTPAAEKKPLSQGEYVFRASGGCSCHTDNQAKGRRLSGGRQLKTPYGAIFSTNITPDKQTGLGNWKAEDFIKAMKKGVGPDKKQFFLLEKHFFPVFPYTSFTKISEADLMALWSYLQTVPPVKSVNKPHEIAAPFGWRVNLIFWKWLNFYPGEFKPNPARSDTWNRGAYLSRALAHCEECHSPRNLLGGLKRDKLFIGSKDGPEGELAPNITPDKETGIGSWERSDLAWFLKSGQKPDGDYAQGLMSEEIIEGYQYLKDSDLDAISEFIMSLDPVRHSPE